MCNLWPAPPAPSDLIGRGASYTTLVKYTGRGGPWTGEREREKEKEELEGTGGVVVCRRWPGGVCCLGTGREGRVSAEWRLSTS